MFNLLARVGNARGNHTPPSQSVPIWRMSGFIQTHTYTSSNNNIATFYTHPSGRLLAGAFQNMSLTSVDNVKSPSLAFRNVSPDAAISNFYTFFILHDGAPTLLETSLQLCAQTLNVTVTGGKTNAAELSRSTTVLEDGGHKFIVPNDTNIYLMGDRSYGDLHNFLAIIFNGTCTIAADGIVTYSSDTIKVLIDALLTEPYDQEAMAVFLNSFAISVTNAIRSYPSWSSSFPGTLYLPQTYVSVSWPWFTLPILLALLTCIFLLATIRHNRTGGLDVWRGSALASLQALGDEAREEMGKGLGRVSAVEQRAEDVKVGLRKDEAGHWVLR